MNLSLFKFLKGIRKVKAGRQRLHVTLHKRQVGKETGLEKMLHKQDRPIKEEGS